MNEKIKFLEMLLADAKKEVELRTEWNYLNESFAILSKEKQDEFYRMRIPSGQRIKDDLKMIRRISLEVERGL